MVHKLAVGIVAPSGEKIHISYQTRVRFLFLFFHYSRATYLGNGDTHSQFFQSKIA